MTTELEDKLYNILLESPLSSSGAEKTLPALKELLREFRTERFWEGKRPRRLSEEQMIRAWATYRRDLRELRERMRQRQQGWPTTFRISRVELEFLRSSIRNSLTSKSSPQGNTSFQWRI